MREGKLEKIKVDEIKIFLDKEIDKSKEDKLHPSPLRLVERKDLILEAENAFRLFMAGELEAAQEKVQDAKEKTADLKNEKKKSSNEAFIQYFDHEIEKAIERKQTGESNELINS